MMGLQIVGMLRCAGALDVFGRGVQSAAELADAARDRSFRQGGSGANRHVDALACHVDDPVVHVELDAQLRVQRRQAGQARQQQVLRHHRACGHPNKPRLTPRDCVANSPSSVLQRSGQPLAVAEKGLAFGGQCEAVGRAVDQARATGLLDPRERARDLADRHRALARDGRQRAERGDPGEHFQLVEVQRVHPAMVGLECRGALRGRFCAICKMDSREALFPARERGPRLSLPKLRSRP